MKLDEGNQQKVLEFVNTHWDRPRECAVCKAQQWLVHPLIYEIHQLNKSGGLVMGGPVIPVAAIECEVCGYIHFFNAKRIGIISSGGEVIKNE